MFRLGDKCPCAVETEHREELKAILAESSAGSRVRYLELRDDERNKNTPYYFEQVALPDRASTPESGLRGPSITDDITDQELYWLDIQEDLSRIYSFFIREDIAIWRSGIQYITTFTECIRLPMYESNNYDSGINRRCRFML